MNHTQHITGSIFDPPVGLRVKNEIPIEGGGIFDRLKKALSSGINKGINLIAKPPYPGFDGEFHSVLKVPGQGLQRASFCGPGTQLIERIKRGDRPLTEVDAACFEHDKGYYRAKNTTDSRLRDMEAVRRMGDMRRSGADSKFNILQPEMVLRAKMALEDTGILDKSKFISTEPPTSEGLALVGNGFFDDLGRDLKKISKRGRDSRGGGFFRDVANTFVDYDGAERSRGRGLAELENLKMMGFGNYKKSTDLGFIPPTIKKADPLKKLRGRIRAR